MRTARVTPAGQRHFRDRFDFLDGVEFDHNELTSLFENAHLMWPRDLRKGRPKRPADAATGGMKVRRDNLDEPVLFEDRCRSCQHILNSASRFCSRCGTPVGASETEPPPPPPPQRCKRCHRIVNTSKLFCNGCQEVTVDVKVGPDLATTQDRREFSEPKAVPATPSRPEHTMSWPTFAAILMLAMIVGAVLVNIVGTSTGG